MYHHHFGLDYTVLRLSDPFGPRQEPNRGQGVIATWCSKIYRNEPVEIWGDGRVVRDYLYIDDAVHAINLAISTYSDIKVFNVGSGKGYSLLNLHALIQKQLGKSVDIVFREMQKVDVPINVLDITLITQRLGWAPKVDMEDGVLRLWKFILESHRATPKRDQT
jgi:UDP-glucose 4-epimerase